MTDVVITILGSMPVTALITWLLARRKNRAEAVVSELDVVEKAIKIWREMSEELKKELEQSRCLITSLKEQVDTLAEENKALRLEVAKLRASNGRIVRALEKLTPENFIHVVNELKQKLNDD